jgi:AcrR family transcriptional regulator
MRDSYYRTVPGRIATLYTESMEQPVRTAGRPRSESVGVSILTATQDLLLEDGFDRMSVESIAARAGVGKGAIYRRWPDKTALVVAAVADLAQVPAVPDTGSLRDDLLACARTFVRTGRTQEILAGLMTAMARHEELRSSARDAIGSPFTHLFRQVIDRAIERGDVPGSVDSRTVSEVFPALAFHRSIALGLPVDEDFVMTVVDGLLMPLLVRPEPPAVRAHDPR